MTAKLARAAARLNAHAKAPRALPPLVLMTDDDRLADPLPAACALPRGSLVVLRAQDPIRRVALAKALMSVARSRGLGVSIAGDPALAARCGADGIHFPEARIGEAAHWRARQPHWLITCAAHSLSACARAGIANVDAAILAPVFTTKSHPGRGGLGLFRARAIAGASPIPVYALGGIDGRNAARLADSGFVGLAAVEGLSRGRTR